MSENSVRIIKISKEALFEYIYENMLDDQETLFDVEPLDVVNYFDIDWESGELLFCAYKAEDENGKCIKLHEEIDLKKLIHKLPDTTSTMYEDDRYKEYTKDDLIKLSNGVKYENNKN